jgi:hypothetical protein
MFAALFFQDNVLPRSVLFIRRSLAEILADERAQEFLLRHNWKPPDEQSRPTNLSSTAEPRLLTDENKRR